MLSRRECKSFANVVRLLGGAGMVRGYQRGKECVLGGNVVLELGRALWSTDADEYKPRTE